MSEFRERRRTPRVAAPKPVSARAHATLEVRLLDLSLGGARIEHVGLLRPGWPCILELPLSVGPLALALTARVVRSQVVGAESGPGGERDLLYQSGLAFVDVTAEQQTALTRVLEGLTPSGGTGGTPQLG